MHRAAEKLPVSLFPRIKAVVMFGDPQQRLGALGDKFPIGLRSKVLQVCAKGDLMTQHRSAIRDLASTTI